MATSRNLGTNFSSHSSSEADALLYLKSLTQSSLCSPITDSLGAQTLFLVGGAVRNAFLGIHKTDIDLACSHPIAECERLLVSSGIRVVQTGLQHGTISAIIDGHNIEITTFRDQQGGAAPSIEADLKARDFTINALAFSFSDLKLLDPCAGLQDLKAHFLRSPAQADRCFSDDPLRILRMVRFGAAEGRKIEANLLEEAKKQAHKLATVKVERIKLELEKILVSPLAAAAFRQISEVGLLPYTVPELADCIDFEQNEFHIHDVFEHTLWVLERCRPELVLRLCALFHDLGKPGTLSVDEEGRRHFYKHEKLSAEFARTRLKALKFSNQMIKDVSLLVELHMRPLECGPAGMRRLVRDLAENFSLWQEFKMADAPPKMTDQEVQKRMHEFNTLLNAELERLRRTGASRLAINGEDLKAIGILPGVKMGKVLKGLEELVIETPELNTREFLLTQARQIYTDLK